MDVQSCTAASAKVCNLAHPLSCGLPSMRTATPYDPKAYVRVAIELVGAFCAERVFRAGMHRISLSPSKIGAISWGADMLAWTENCCAGRAHRLRGKKVGIGLVSVAVNETGSLSECPAHPNVRLGPACFGAVTSQKRLATGTGEAEALPKDNRALISWGSVAPRSLSSVQCGQLPSTRLRLPAGGIAYQPAVRSRSGSVAEAGRKAVACCFATAIDLGSGWPIEYH
jgi:hypothetical protein